MVSLANLVGPSIVAALLGPLIVAALLGPSGAAAQDSHWAWSPPAAVDVPPGDVAHPIDRFVRARLAHAGLTPSRRAEPALLLRRLHLDLTGLPPAPEDVAAFVAEPSEAAWSASVDRLLADPAYGEHWARWWLDLARYADTQGYEKDGARSVWRWRDWVIDALQADMPFDRFTIEQLAGDLLPDATGDQILATAFHRNTMTNDEGGTDDEEFRVAALVDRVNTTMEVWMGLTMGCAQCHDHKVDPFTQEEYYRLFAFFDQTADADRADDQPTLREATPREAERIAEMRARARALEAAFVAEDPELDAAQRAWEAGVLARLDEFEAMELAWSPWVEVDRGTAHSLDSAPGTVRWHRRTVTAAREGSVALSIACDGGFQLWVNQEARVARGPRGNGDTERLGVEVWLPAGETTIELAVASESELSSFELEALSDDLPSGIFGLLRTPPAQRPAAQAQYLLRYFRANHVPRFRDHAERLAALRGTVPRVLPPTPILRELPAGEGRTTHVLRRGSFLDPGEVVAPGVPALFPPLAESRRDRLALARWLVSPENPLTARVTVNRVWEQLFGLGLVETTEDFGLRGAPPSHPELLDWLARRFVADGWSVQSLLRTIVTSETYRQSSAIREEDAGRDPRNVLLARGPRVRLAAEELRDTALRVADLLSPRRWGPPVFPPQPAGLWRVVYSEASWIESPPPDRWRRGLYTFWRRTQPYPSAVIFDAPTREVCVSRRHRTNTPLQALVLLNDPVFVEAGQALGRRALRDLEGDDAERVAGLFRLALARDPSAAELDRLTEFVAAERRARAADPEAARRYATDPLGPLPAGLDPADAAAWTALAHLLLNLDEFVAPR